MTFTRIKKKWYKARKRKNDSNNQHENEKAIGKQCPQAWTGDNRFARGSKGGKNENFLLWKYIAQ